MDIRRSWWPMRFGLSLIVRRNPVGTLLATEASVVGCFNYQRGCCRRPPGEGIFSRLLPLCAYHFDTSINRGTFLWEIRPQLDIEDWECMLRTLAWIGEQNARGRTRDHVTTPYSTRAQ